jgi:hypothetical protein
LLCVVTTPAGHCFITVSAIFAEAEADPEAELCAHTPCAATHPHTTKAATNLIQIPSQAQKKTDTSISVATVSMRTEPQSHASAVQTPAPVPLAPLTLISTKFPAATATLPVAVQLPPEATEQANPESAMLPGTPCRSVTLIVFDCCENTVSRVAVQPAGTQVNTAAPSLALEFELFTE